MTTRAELFTAVRNWTRRTTDTELDVELPRILRNVEARFAREIIHSSMTRVETLNVTGRSATLPSTCLQLRSVSLVQATLGRRTLDNVTPEVLREGPYWNGSGEPRQYAVENRELYVAPAASEDDGVDLDISYYARFPALTAEGDTNYLLTNYFDLYLYAMLSETMAFVQDIEAGTEYEARYVDVRRELINQDMTYRASGSVVRRIGSGFKV